jgi:excisionase family DNA binding protein
MHNIVLSQIDSETLISSISERVTANILEAVRNEQPSVGQPEQLLTIDEVSVLLHLTKPTIYSKVSKNELPGVCKQGKRLYFDRQTIINWIREGRKKSNAEIKEEAEANLISNTKRRSKDSNVQNRQELLRTVTYTPQSRIVEPSKPKGNE